MINMKYLLSAILLCSVIGAQAAVDIPEFKDSFECSTWVKQYQSKANKAYMANIDDNKILAGEYQKYSLWFDTFKRNSGFSSTTKCNNGACTASWYMGSNGDNPSAGGCMFAGTSFWPQIVDSLQTEVTNLDVSPLPASLPTILYGVIQEHLAPGQKSDFNSGTLIKRDLDL